MASPEDQILERISKYEERRIPSSSERMEVDDHNSERLEKDLDLVIQEYETRLQAHKEELNQLQRRTAPLASITTPSSNPQDRLKQLRGLKLAYDKVTNSKPDLPGPMSILPALLAAKQLNESNLNCDKAIESELDKLDWAERHAKAEENNLADLKQLSDALRNRITRLTAAKEEQSSLAPVEASRRLLKTKAKRRKELDDESHRLNDALIGFIRLRLGAMIAAEEIGGPVVGDLGDITEEVLSAGFSTQGRPKPATAKPISDSKRQQRIDEIWGGVAGDGQAISEDEAAIAEMSRLIETLLQLAHENAGSYLDLERDSAASRFLVRAKVAQFHPKDARKLRLLDFGRELND